MSKVQRVSMTSDSTGKIIHAMLQEADTMVTDGSHSYWTWHDVRELPVSPDGRVTIFTNQGVISSSSPKSEVPQAFQDAFSDGELEL